MTLTLVNQGVTPTEAMRKAGYAESTVRNPKQKLLRSNAVLDIVQQVKFELEDQGLTVQFLVQKYKQLIEAKKTDPDNYEVQLKDVKEIMVLHGVDRETKRETPKRRITLEEFIAAD